MQNMTKFWIAIGLFSIASVASQYGSGMPVDLSWLLGEGWWVPLSAFTVIPLLDVMRSFTQHYGEQASVSFKKQVNLMMVIPFTISFICVMIADLPFTIFLGAICAVNGGGLFDIYIFKMAKRISDKPYIRMMFSNAAATLTGGALFFAVAFSDLVPTVASWFGIEFVNVVARGDLVQGWAVQSFCIWVGAVGIGTIMGKVIESIESKRA